jgi:hypothetical protein
MLYPISGKDWRNLNHQRASIVIWKVILTGSLHLGLPIMPDRRSPQIHPALRYTSPLSAPALGGCAGIIVN